ncbi:MAG TPA: hypothetical protein VN645_08140 [Steroidobacteraceae bacterium]|nr:hypothetical protein [Steroidobacteraceae bacterium]
MGVTEVADAGAGLLSQYVNWIGRFFQSRVVLAHPDAPEDTRVVNLFRYRAELKKELGDAQDEIHRLRDRVKLQEAATARVREQLEALEARLSVPLSGLNAILHYQLRDLWAATHAQIASLVRELAQQREDRERRQFLADLNRQTFERAQSVRAELADAERAAADVRAKLAGLNQALEAARAWWKYFSRRELQRRRLAMQAESRAAEQVLQEARAQLQQIEEQGGAKYPGLSLAARRTLNLTALASAQVLTQRLAPPALLARVQDAMSRSEPKSDSRPDAQACMAAMQEVARARAAMLQGQPTLGGEVKRLADRLAASATFRTASETVPLDTSVRSALIGDAPGWDVLGQDLWSVSDLFYE